MRYRPPKDDTERFQNLLEGLAERGDGDDAFSEIMRKDLAERGLTLETWAATWEARAREAVARRERARRARRNRTFRAVFGGFAVAAGVVLILYIRGRGTDMADRDAVEPKMRPVPSAIQPDAGPDASTRK